jgi:hypothetical protein
MKVIEAAREALETTLDRKFRSLVRMLREDEPSQKPGRHAGPSAEQDEELIAFAERLFDVANLARRAGKAISFTLTREEWHVFHAVVCREMGCVQPCLHLHPHDAALKSWITYFDLEEMRATFNCRLIYCGDVHFQVIPLP